MATSADGDAEAAPAAASPPKRADGRLSVGVLWQPEAARATAIKTARRVRPLAERSMFLVCAPTLRNNCDADWFPPGSRRARERR